jgi:hypothetical protein
MATEFSEVFLGDQLCEQEVDIHSILTRVIAQDNLIEWTVYLIQDFHLIFLR